MAVQNIKWIFTFSRTKPWSKLCTKIRQNISKIAKKYATRQPNQKIAKFGGKIAHLATMYSTVQ